MIPIQFPAASLQVNDKSEQVQRIITSALDAVDPYQAIKNSLKCYRKSLIASGQLYHLDNYQHIYLIGAGKACIPMTQAVIELIGDRINRGIIIVKDGFGQKKNFSLPDHINIYEASHPLPDERGIIATQKITDLLSASSPDDLVIFLISGGGSALLTQPVDGVNLQDLRIITQALLGCGASINEINILRKHLDLVKGGQLVSRFLKGQMITLILSDVIGNPLDIIASGPTIPDQSTFSMAKGILDKYSLREITPGIILSHLDEGINGIIPDTPKQDNPIFQRVQNILIGSNEQACQSAFHQATQEGFKSRLLSGHLTGEASQAGYWLGETARKLASSHLPSNRPDCWIIGGETTVTLRGAGLGGRNQETALATVELIAGLNNILIVTLATDGEDGPTDAAGAVVTGDTLARAEKFGLNPGDYLARNDSYHFFDALSDLIRTGPTLTNVNDLALIFAF